MQRFIKGAFYGLLFALVTVQRGGVLFGASLEENSPFIPFDYVSHVAPVVGPQKGGVELRGVLDFDGQTRFSLYNPVTQKSVWVGLKDKRAPYYVDSYDPEKFLVTVVVNGVKQQLPMSKPTEEAMPVNSGTAAGGPRIPTVPPKPEVKEEPADKEGDEEEVPEEDPEKAKRRQMSEKVYEAFKKYVSEKKAREMEK